MWHSVAIGVAALVVTAGALPVPPHAGVADDVPPVGDRELDVAIETLSEAIRGGAGGDAGEEELKAATETLVSERSWRKSRLDEVPIRESGRRLADDIFDLTFADAPGDDIHQPYREEGPPRKRVKTVFSDSRVPVSTTTPPPI